MKKKFKMLCGYQGRANYGKYGRYLAVKNKGRKCVNGSNRELTEN